MAMPIYARLGKLMGTGGNPYDEMAYKMYVNTKNVQNNNELYSKTDHL